MSKEQLVVDNMKLVYFLIYKYFPTWGQDEDVQQEGMIGLINAANTWNEEKGVFSTYASTCILNHLRNYFKSQRKIPNTLSLNTEVSDAEGNTIEMQDFLIGEEDVDVDSIVYQEFYNQLTDKEKELISLSVSHTRVEIGEMYGVSHQRVSQWFRKIRLKWRNFNGNNSN